MSVSTYEFACGPLVAHELTHLLPAAGVTHVDLSVSFTWRSRAPRVREGGGLLTFRRLPARVSVFKASRLADRCENAGTRIALQRFLRDIRAAFQPLWSQEEIEKSSEELSQWEMAQAAQERERVALGLPLHVPCFADYFGAATEDERRHPLKVV